MAWVKIPAENHPIFLAAMPSDPRVSSMKMFGGLAAIVNGYMFGGLFGKSFIVRLSAADQVEAMQLDGAQPFDPMGNGRVMKDTIFMPEAALDEDAELRSWLRKAFEYSVTLPPKEKKAKPAARAAKPAVASKAKPAKKSAPSPPARPPAKKPKAGPPAKKPKAKPPAKKRR